MGLNKLNPFKKSSSKAEADDLTTSRSHLSPNDGLAPQKSTSSFANSVRSFGDKAENFFAEGERPREVMKRDGKIDASRQFPTISTGGLGTGTLSPSPSAGLM